MRAILFILFLFLQPPKVEVLEKSKYQVLVAKGYTIIDVRSPEEFNEGHIEGAQNINVKDDGFVSAIQKAKPSGVKGMYIKRVAVSSSQGPGVRVEISALGSESAT